MPEFETLLYEAIDGVAWVTLNRPEFHNAFNVKMQAELKGLWTALRSDDNVRCIVITGAGDRAFCTGVDRAETMGDWADDPDWEAKAPAVAGGGKAWHWDDPGDSICPKSNDLWKPMIAAVNGMVCGGGLYLLGEVEFVVAAEHATFFDPHVTYGMVAAFEPIHMLQKMPFHEVARMALVGTHERMSAQRAYEIGLVSEVVPAAQLREKVQLVAAAIASAPPIAIQGTLRALWAARDLSRREALAMGKVLVRAASDSEALLEGQRAFASRTRAKPNIR